MKISECPKFNTCNASVCILDREWQKRKHHHEDACCFYLLESQKQDAEANFRGAGLEQLYAIALTVAPVIAERHAPIRRNIQRCKTTGSRMNRFGRATKFDGQASADTEGKSSVNESCGNGQK